MVAGVVMSSLNTPGCDAAGTSRMWRHQQGLCILNSVKDVISVKLNLIRGFYMGKAAYNGCMRGNKTLYS